MAFTRTKNPQAVDHWALCCPKSELSQLVLRTLSLCEYKTKEIEEHPTSLPHTHPGRNVIPSIRTHVLTSLDAAGRALSGQTREYSPIRMQVIYFNDMLQYNVGVDGSDPRPVCRHVAFGRGEILSQLRRRNRMLVEHTRKVKASDMIRFHSEDGCVEAGIGCSLASDPHLGTVYISSLYPGESLCVCMCPRLSNMYICIHTYMHTHKHTLNRTYLFTKS
jgi:hypothetical protein